MFVWKKIILWWLKCVEVRRCSYQEIQYDHLITSKGVYQLPTGNVAALISVSDCFVFDLNPS